MTLTPPPDGEVFPALPRAAPSGKISTLTGSIFPPVLTTRLRFVC